MINDDVDAFLRWAEHDRLRSPATLKRYRASLASFSVYADPLTATLEQAEEWWQSRESMSPATRNNELACLRAFYGWAVRFDHVDKDPTRRLTRPKVDNAYPRPIARADLLRALDACDERGTPELRRAIALGAYAGLRVSEAANLDWSMVDMEHHTLRFRGKGRKERICGASTKLLDEILPDTGGNVVMAGGTPYTADALQRRVNRHLVRIGSDATFHCLRARYVTQAIAETGNIFAVANAVGWATIETAKHYATISDDTMQQIALAASR